MNRQVRTAFLSLACVAAAAGVSACAVVLGLPEPGLDDDAGVEGGGQDTGQDTGDATIQLAACPNKPGYVCTPGPIPPGWAVVSYGPDDAPGCPEKYGAREDVLGDIHGDPRSCSCSCTGRPECKTFELKRYAAPGCNGPPKATVLTATYPTQTGVCESGGYPATLPPITHRLEPVPVPSTACSPAVVAGARGPVKAVRGRMCSPVEGGKPLPCATGVCVPQAPAPYAACIAHDGLSSCPSGYGRRTVVGLGAPGFTDTRECTPCTCRVSGLCSASLIFSPAADCSPSPVQVTGDCTTEGNSDGMVAHRFGTYANTLTCAVDAPSVAVGEVAPAAPRTICCP